MNKRQLKAFYRRYIDFTQWKQWIGVIAEIGLFVLFFIMVCILFNII